MKNLRISLNRCRLSKITHYEQRLRTLHYKKKFNIWYSELKPKIMAVLEASKEVQRSKRLRKMLEIILAFGNYMNRGQKGNAVGFKLSSLTRIADTKSSCTKNMTLLHYIVDTCEKKVSFFSVKSQRSVYKRQRSIFQTFWKVHCWSKSLFFELETSNFGYLLIFSFC